MRWLEAFGWGTVALGVAASAAAFVGVLDEPVVGTIVGLSALVGGLMTVLRARRRSGVGGPA